jgi:hypothetical protein
MKTNFDYSLNIYFNWSLVALIGKEPVKVDNYLKENLIEIQQVARSLLYIINYKPAEIYRGVILKHDQNYRLKPHPNFTYLSFSEDINIAKSFADPGPNGFGSVYFLGHFGFIIKYTPTIEEILFHHKFLNILPYASAFEQLGIIDNVTMFQKEVIILQPEEPFKMIRHINV